MPPFLKKARPTAALRSVQCKTGCIQLAVQIGYFRSQLGEVQANGSEEGAHFYRFQVLMDECHRFGSLSVVAEGNGKRIH